MEDNFRPTVMVTNDDGMDAPGLRALVTLLVSTNRFHILVCAPDSEKSAVSHSITWRHALSVKQVDISGATAFAVSEYTRVRWLALGRLSSMVFLLCLYHITGPIKRETMRRLLRMAANTVLTVLPCMLWRVCCARVRVRGKSNVNDFTLAAKACLPIISAILAEIKIKHYPQNCFLNIDVPTDVINHKGYRLTRQGKSLRKMGWRQVTSETGGEKILSTMTMEMTNSSESTDARVLKNSAPDHLLFKRQVTGILVENGDTDYCSLQEGYITVTPLGGLSPAELDAFSFFQNWLPNVAGHYPSSAL
ncbi:uncharacterized protein LOC132043264 isoform X4 [Lycium ferocissimum]|uniref:uncharacterized protein LOC132043264 isoform X4 n=1 Tax=Lycium ferocissimum TaxID=112874 RepID=UPI0028151053|nr:uncharacterized protein LOC132043264 isoform X4 [Lycium ferocissimum]